MIKAARSTAVEKNAAKQALVQKYEPQDDEQFNKVCFRLAQNRLPQKLRSDTNVEFQYPP